MQEVNIETLARNWWARVLRGVAGVIFGVLTFLFPAMTLAALLLLFGTYAVVDGIFNLIAAVAGRVGHDGSSSSKVSSASPPA